MSSSPRERQKYRAYPNTILEFEGPPRLRLDLRRPLTPERQREIDALGLGGPFAVVTAENPRGENAEDAADSAAAGAREARNDRRSAALEDALRHRGIPFRRVAGVSTDGGYREDCLAVALPRSEAVSLAAELDQLALFWYDGSAFWLLPVEVDAEPERLPDWRG